MKFAISLCVFFIRLSQTKTLDGPKYQCQSDNNGMITVNCEMDDVQSSSNQTCDTVSETAKYLKFECNSSNSVDLRSNIIGKFPNLNSMLILSLGIEQIYIDNSTILENLSKFNASLNKLHQIPQSMFQSMPNLLSIDFSYNEFQTINSVDFVGATKLEWINFEFNQISSLENEAFSMLDHLKYLNLRSNRITLIAEDIFPMNKNIVLLDLDMNPLEIVNLNALSTERNVSITLRSIKRLDLCCRNSTTPLDGISKMDALENVQYFNASHNQINVIDPSLINEMSGILEIDFSNNKIESINGTTFHGAFKLNRINLAHNDIRQLEFGASTEQVECLDLSHNRLGSQNTNFSSLRNVQHLDVSDNQLANLDINTFSTNVKIRFLSLGQNGIGSLVYGIFSNLADLEQLDLSRNLLTTLDSRIFETNKNMQVLNLSHNSLTNLANGLVSAIIELKRLDLSFNKIKALDSSLFDKNTKLDVQGNPLTSHAVSNNIIEKIGRFWKNLFSKYVEGVFNDNDPNRNISTAIVREITTTSTILPENMSTLDIIASTETQNVTSTITSEIPVADQTTDTGNFDHFTSAVSSNDTTNTIPQNTTELTLEPIDVTSEMTLEPIVVTTAVSSTTESTTMYPEANGSTETDESDNNSSTSSPASETTPENTSQAPIATTLTDQSTGRTETFESTENSTASPTTAIPSENPSKIEMTTNQDEKTTQRIIEMHKASTHPSTNYESTLPSDTQKTKFTMPDNVTKAPVNPKDAPFVELSKTEFIGTVTSVATLVAIMAMVIVYLAFKNRTSRDDPIEMAEIKPNLDQSRYDDPIYDEPVAAEPVYAVALKKGERDANHQSDARSSTLRRSPDSVRVYENVVQVMASNGNVQLYGQVNKASKKATTVNSPIYSNV